MEIIFAEIGRRDFLELLDFSFSLLSAGRDRPESMEMLRCILSLSLLLTLGSVEVILESII